MKTTKNLLDAYRTQNLAGAFGLAEYVRAARGPHALGTVEVIELSKMCLDGVTGGYSIAIETPSKIDYLSI